MIHSSSESSAPTTSTATVSSVTSPATTSADSSEAISSSATTHQHSDATSPTTSSAASMTADDVVTQSSTPTSTFTPSSHWNTLSSSTASSTSVASTVSPSTSITSSSSSTSSSSHASITSSSASSAETSHSSTTLDGSSSLAFDPTFLQGAQALAMTSSTTVASESTASPSLENSVSQDLQASTVVSGTQGGNTPPTPTVFSSGHEALQLVSPTQSDDVADPGTTANAPIRPSPSTTTDTADDSPASDPAEITPAPSPVLHAVSLPAATSTAISSPALASTSIPGNVPAPTPTAAGENPLAALLVAATAAASSRSVARFGSTGAPGPSANAGAVLATQDLSTTLSTATMTSMPFGATSPSSAVLGAGNGLVSSTIVRQGPSGTIAGITGSGSFTPAPTATPVATPGPVAHQQEEAASHRPLIIFGAIFGAFVLIGGIATIVGWIRKRLRQGKSFLWWKGHVRPDMMEELGFGSDYDPFRAGFKQQNKEITTRLQTEGVTPTAEQDEHSMQLDSTADDSMPVYLMHDASYHYPVANYVPGDASTSRQDTQRHQPPKPWSPLQPRRGAAYGAPTWEDASFSPPSLDDKFASSDMRMSRRSTIKLDSQEADVTDALSSDVPPLPASIAQYYASDGAVEPNAHYGGQNPFADFVPSLQQPLAIDENSPVPSTYRGGHVSPYSDAPLRDVYTTASVYSTTSLTLPAVEVSESMSSLRRVITEVSGFHIESEDDGDGYNRPVRSPAERPGSQTSFAATVSSTDTTNSEDDHAVLTALHNRKVSLADRTHNADAVSMDRGISALSMLQRR